jgi:REP element-mobilizing transposase RayT
MTFITVRTHARQRLFGDIIDGEMRLNAAGSMVGRAVESLPGRHAGIDIGSFVVMPDHIHMIVACGTEPDVNSPTVGTVLKSFKGITVAAYRVGVQMEHWQPYAKHLWQADYYDHIIRNADDLATREAYIEANPSRWWAKRRGDSG